MENYEYLIKAEGWDENEGGWRHYSEIITAPTAREALQTFKANYIPNIILNDIHKI